ncbi:MAG: TRAP transporter substrate-binding protein [Spirochaetaceae bacterium]|nr:MAG: TRAP transporter substrate-binding protein [Spirochaetaceae bacterium]
MSVCMIALLFGSPVIALAAGTSEADPTETITLRIASSHAGGSFAEEFLTEYKERVEQQLGDRIEIIVVMDGVLGAGDDVLQGLGSGLFQASLAASEVMATNSAANVFELPYLFADRSEVLTLINSPAYDLIAAGFQENNVRLAAIWDNGFRVITNNVRPIVTPDDLQGVILRTPQSPTRMRMFAELGANPTPMPFGEVYSALDTGVIDGQENPASYIYASGLLEVQKYMSISNHVYLPTFLLFGEPFIAQTPDEILEVLFSVAQELTEWTLEQGHAADEDVIDRMANLVAINAIDAESFQTAALTLYDTPLFADRIGDEMIQASLEALGRR